MKQGAATSPVSLRPKTQQDREARQHQGHRDDLNLREQARFVGITESDAGKLMITLIQEHLARRIEILVKDDPEARALEGLLNQLGVKYAAAQQAVAKLYERNFEKKTG